MSAPFQIRELGFLLCFALNLTVWGEARLRLLRWIQLDGHCGALWSYHEVFLGEKRNFMHHSQKIITTLKLEGPNGRFLLATNKILLQKVPCLENPGMESQPANSQGINSGTPRVEGSGEAFGAHQPLDTSRQLSMYLSPANICRTASIWASERGKMRGCCSP